LNNFLNFFQDKIYREAEALRRQHQEAAAAQHVMNYFQP